MQIGLAKALPTGSWSYARDDKGVPESGGSAEERGEGVLQETVRSH